jgi:predicted DNA-binding transcriptional regulator AlpA
MSTKPPVLPNKPSLRILRKPALRDRLGGCSDHHLDDLEKRYGFPQRLRLTRHSVGWIEHEVDAWIETRMRSRDPDARAQCKEREHEPETADAGQSLAALSSN